MEAYTTVREILQRFLADDDERTESLAASAKGSLIYSWTEKEETVEDLVGQTVKAYMRQTDTKYNRCYKYAADISGVKKPSFVSPQRLRVVAGPRDGVGRAGGGPRAAARVPGGGLLKPPHLGQHGLQLGGGGLGGGPPGANTVPVLQLVLTLQTSL